MIQKLAIITVTVLMLFVLTTPVTASAQEWDKNDVNMTSVDQGETLAGRTGTSVDCPEGQCHKYFSPGYFADGTPREPVDAAKVTPKTSSGGETEN